MDDAFRWPRLDPIEVHPTQYHPMAPVWQNEGTNQGTIGVLDDYEENQCGFKPDDPRWETILMLWHGDVKSTLRLRSVQELRMFTSNRAYDSKKWLLPILGLWHLRFNLLKLIHRIHWGGSQPSDQSCLQYAADAWGRSDVHKASEFVKLEELLTHSYQARILGLFIQQSGRSFKRIDDAFEWVNGLGYDEFRERLQKVVHSFYPPNLSASADPTPINEPWWNHQCFVRHMDIYFLLRFSIKTGDIGLLRQALREVCVLVQAKEGKCDNYGPEMLRMLHIVDSHASATSLQRAVLSNMLVNLGGVANRTFEVDRLVEFLNKLVSVTKRDRVSSTKPIQDLLKQITLTAPYLLELKTRLESKFGRQRKGYHPIKKAAEDIWTMAKDLCENDFKRREQDKFSAYPAIDLRRSGFQSLGDNIAKYNRTIATGISIHLDPDLGDNLTPDNDPQSETNIEETRTTLNTSVDDEMEDLLAELT